MISLPRNRKKQVWDVLEAVFIFYWCSYLSRVDSYYSPYLLVAFAGLFCFVRNRQMPHTSFQCRLDFIVTIFCACLLSSFVVLANYKQFVGLSDGKFAIAQKLLSLMFLFAGGFLLFFEISVCLSHEYPNICDTLSPRADKVIFGGAWLSIALVNSIFLFGAEYPGVLTPDSTSQMNQLLTHSYSNHHPYYHTQIIHGCISIGYRLFGSINAAVATYSVFSIIVMAFCFAYVIYTVCQSTRHVFLTVLVFLTYLFMPYHIMYSFTMWKDIFFGAAVTLFVVGFYRSARKIGNHYGIDFAIMAVAAVGICLMRSNGWVAFALSTACFALLFRNRKKKFLLLFVVVLLGTFILKHPVLKALHVSQPDTIESLSIPAQQIARVIADGKEISLSQEKLLNQITDVSAIPETYSSYISDPIKNLVRASGNQDYILTHKGEFAKLYLQLGLKYPYKYLEAWIDQTRGYWNAGYSYWRWASGIFENSIGIFHTVHSTVISKVLLKYLSLWDDSSILQLFLCIGLHVWCCILAAYTFFVRRDFDGFFATVPFLAVILSLLIATPVFAEFRYAYSIFCGVPFIVAILFSSPKNEESLHINK